MEKKIKAAILGATGTVGQRFVQLLEKHPWFEASYLAASGKSAGKTYAETGAWRLSAPMPERMKGMVVHDIEPGFDASIVFSGLDASVAGSVEESFAKAGYAVISNASSHRMDEDVPLLVPEINSEHLKLIEHQKSKRGYRGFIVTNPNCSSITLALALAPLERQFGLESVCVSTMQAVSGAGYPGVSSMDILGNVIPYIAGEEEKIEQETRKILGRLADKFVELHPVKLSAQTNRVGVVDGHTETVFVKFSKHANVAQIRDALRTFRSVPQDLGLPSAPDHPVILKDEIDRPQPRFDVELEKGMSTIVGRVRECPVFDARFVILGHNTIRGAAGAAILNAELLKAQGYL